MIGERTSGFEITWIRNTSDMERLDYKLTTSLPIVDSLDVCPEETRDQDLELSARATYT